MPSITLKELSNENTNESAADSSKFVGFPHPLVSPDAIHIQPLSGLVNNHFILHSIGKRYTYIHRSPIYGQISHDHGLVPISAKLVVTTSVNRAVLSIGVNFRGTPGIFNSIRNLT